MRSGGQTVILAGDSQRAFAHRLVEKAPPRAVLTITEERRSTEQNAKLWSMLSDVARARPQGRVLPTEIWKCLFMHACGLPVRFEPALDGNGVVAIGFRSSRLTKVKMSELIESIYAFGAEHGIEWTEERSA